tara:strand:- start:6076 stop:7236 length:1161 start_codon:yes stop_codon:yes gene_type:complete
LPTKYRFSEEDKKIISEYWYIGCETPKPLGAHQMCNTHGFKHRKTPDVYTMAKLIELFPEAPLEAWGQVFNCSREAIRVLYLQISKGNSWSKDRQERMFGAKPDMAKFNTFFDIFADDVTLTKEEIMELCEVTNSELQHWCHQDDEFNGLWKNAVSKRKHKKQFPTEMKCYRCGVVKPLDDFGYSKQHKNNKSRTCNQCNVMQVKTYMVKRQEEFDITKVDKGKVCPGCNIFKTRADYNIAKHNRGGLQSRCIACQNKAVRKSPIRKKKFLDAGFDKPKYECAYCLEDKLVTDYYLIRIFRGNEAIKFMTNCCQDCVDNIYTTLGDKEMTKAQFVQQWRADCMKARKVTNLYDFVDYLNMRYIVHDVQHTIDKTKEQDIVGRYDGV